jgi:carboxylesterase
VRFSAAVFVAAVATGCYNAVMTGLAHRFDDHQRRNPYTGVLYGAEELDLGPRDADTAVILVHGFVGASNNFNELPKRLADAGYRVRALRLPGHGTTPFDLEQAPPADMLNYVVAEVRTLKEQHKHVFLVGHSMGGALGVLAATTSDVDGLVLAGPHFKVTHRWFYLLPVETWNALTGWAVRWVYKGDAFIQVERAEVKHDIVSYRYIPAAGTAAIQHFAALARDPDTLAMVDCPVLMLEGTLDLAASPAAAEKAFGRIASKDKKLVWLEKSNHHVFWDYDREQVYKEILDFIASES